MSVCSAGGGHDGVGRLCLSTTDGKVLCMGKAD